MELKDMILQTLDEFKQDDFAPQTQTLHASGQNTDMPQPQRDIVICIDSRFLELLREKTLVLFEGLQSSHTKDLPSKLDLVINYLEYQLSLIEETLQKQ
ncbi:hypothetical protein LW135_07330 [Helicobacter sp. faydin-H20]|uniref:CiaD-like domain-containing protein n=1 Tax=Helicobacter anatolicus TaxID=2905874 RepID=UPI001E62B096|nr:hypothetical protein [Helicobacter anatolicus]MCE3037631.1 hypothetical protein [Helicobacter anatolicus]